MQRRKRARCGDFEDGPTATDTGPSSAGWGCAAQSCRPRLDQRSGLLEVSATILGAKVVQRGKRAA